MKKCPFCAEDIQEEAIKCRFCNEFLDESYKPKQKTRWYYSTSAIVIALITIGPFALPLVWKNPKYNITTKAVITIVLIAVTIWLCYLMGSMYQKLIEQVTSLGL
jgi:predicted nucleic acid-binding Zn ribbon protein